jgi:UDP-4-amino-4,6-dideoxy-N-acetyl-beta-L-altrosamine transaminase
VTSAFLPYGRQTIEADDVAAVVESLGADMLTTGPLVERFEQAFASATGARHAVVCNSGTAALHLAVLAIGIGPGDAAIVPAITFLATANVVRMTGAEVVFADVDPDRGVMTPATLADAIERARRAGLRPRVALPVHLNGQLCDMPALAALAARHGCDLVEDACHSLGVTDVGATKHSRIACFSTHPVKAIATGEGGAVTTADAALAARMRRLRSHGMVREPAAFQNRALSFDGDAPNPWSYEMPEIGWNYRLPDLLCALGLSQIAKLERFLARRRALVALYDAAITRLAPSIGPVPHGDRPHGWHLYVLLFDFDGLGISRRQVMDGLRRVGVGTQVHYPPVHRQPYYEARYGAQTLPGADRYYARCLSMPLFPAMADGDVERVVAAVADVTGRG